jgi:ferredoxin
LATPGAGKYLLHITTEAVLGVCDMAVTQTLVDKSTSSEELAYMLLEEARLRCQALLEDSLESYIDPDGLSMNGLYGDLGIAGYYASARLEPARRRQLLAQARARADRDDATSVRALADVTAAATRTVERALTVTGLLDHMHLAHIHVMSACEALDAMFALQA